MPSIRQIIYFSLLCTYFVSGQDHSINFDGFDDNIRISDHADLDLTQDYTLEAWIFPETFAWLGGIISKYHTPGANGYMLRLTYQSPYTGLGFDELVTGTGLLSANQWYHIAAVKNGGERKLFINGAESSLSGSALNVTTNNNSVRIGSDYGSRFFDGRIDEVRIWNTPRTQDEIIATMDIDPSNEEGLVAYYNFNEGAGDTLFDLSGNGHNGLLIGNPSWVDGYTLSGILGDVNFDETLNVYDAVMLVALMLQHESGTELQLEACDTNQDGVVDIGDIILLFEWLLMIDPGVRNGVYSGSYSVSEDQVTISSDGDIAGFQVDLLRSNMEVDILLPSGWAWDRSGTKLVAYSVDGSSLSHDFTFVLEDVSAIKNIKIAGWGNTSTIAQKGIFPTTFGLSSSPNPFNPGCNIRFELLRSENINIQLYGINGKFVQNIMQGSFESGTHDFYWEPNNIASGTYFLKISGNKHFEYKKILFLK